MNGGAGNVMAKELYAELLQVRKTAFAELDRKMEEAMKLQYGPINNFMDQSYTLNGALWILEQRKSDLERMWTETISDFFTFDNRYRCNCVFPLPDVNFNDLKTRIRLLKEEADVLKWRFTEYLSCFNHVGETSGQNRRGNRQEERREADGLLSEKLKIIRHYLIFPPKSVAIENLDTKSGSKDEEAS